MALQLSAARRTASSHLRTAVEACLHQLAMEQSRFDVRIGWDLVHSPAGEGESLLIGDGATLLGVFFCALRLHLSCDTRLQLYRILF